MYPGSRTVRRRDRSSGRASSTARSRSRTANPQTGRSSQAAHVTEQCAEGIITVSLRNDAAAGQSACAVERILQEVARGVVRVRLRNDPVSGERVAVDRRTVPVQIEDYIAICRGFVPHLLARHTVKRSAHAPPIGVIAELGARG